MESTSSHIELLKRGQRVAITATIAILLLSVAKFVAGYLFDSRILIADAFHSGVETGWELLGEDEPIKFGQGGAQILAQ